MIGTLKYGLLSLCLLGFASFGQAVKFDIAQSVAQNFFATNPLAVKQIADKDFQIVDNHIKTFDNQILYFIFKFNPHGYIIISGDYRITPVLAFDINSTFNEDNLPPALNIWLNAYEQQIIRVLKNNPGIDSGMKNKWSVYMQKPLQLHNNQSSDHVEPLIRSIWEQGRYYNDSCPEHPQGPGGNCYAGCVATALSQILYYYRYPQQGNGSHSYVLPQYDTISADFGNTVYKWNEMVNYIFAMPNPAIAELVFHSGVAVSTYYGPNGSGSYLDLCVDALKEYFKYDTTAEFYIRSDTSTLWENTIRQNLDNLQPVIYGGGEWSQKHAFVCDGYYDTAYFHFNFGWWNGSGNGYYHIDDITPFNYNFTPQQRAVINIFPRENYPYYPSGTDTLTSPRGSLEDGSGPLSYQNNTDASWLIAPETDSVLIMLYFDDFETESGNDILTIYDGDNPSANILGTFSGDNIPPSISSSENRMLIRFQSNESHNYQGWFAHYTIVAKQFCLEWIELTDTSGYIEDGSGLLYDYTNETVCRWFINPQSEENDSISGIVLSFYDFYTEQDKDELIIYAGPTNDYPVISAISGETIPAPITSSSNQLLLDFQTDEINTRHGFSAKYSVVLPVYCEDTVNLPNPNGIITDGSGPKRYVNNSDCYWLIEPPNVDTIALKFTAFDLEYGYDWVEVIDPVQVPPIVLGHFTGNTIPPLIKSGGGELLIHFYSDFIINKTGWTAEYNVSNQIIIEKNIIESFTIHPNPCSGTAYLRYSILDTRYSIFELYSIQGIKVKTLLNEIQQPGKYVLEFDVSGLPGGLYFVRMQSGDLNAVGKLVVIR